MKQGVRGVLVAMSIAAAVVASGCAAGAVETPPSATSKTAEPSRTPTATPTPTPPPDSDGDGVADSLDDFPEDAARFKQLYYASGDPVISGYPVVVDTAQLDRRLASWIETPQAVALAPGVYVGYNPAVTDLAVYLAANIGDGVCAVRDLYEFGGGACWDGVLASPAEPQP